MDLIVPELRAQLRELSLRALRSTQAPGFGLQNSRNRGAGLEFAQYRAYEPGDEPRSIDWRLYARSDRWYVREAERESPLTLWLLIDTTASMRQADESRAHWTRLDAARLLAACAIEIALRQGDRFGLILINDRGVQRLPAATGARQRDRCLLALTAASANGQWPQQSVVETVFSHVHAGELVLALGDGLEPEANALVARLARAGRQVHHLQILTASERDFPWRGSQRFVDPETSEIRETDAGAVRSSYLAAFASAAEALSTQLREAGVNHVVHMLDEPPIMPLRALFGRSHAREAGA